MATAVPPSEAGAETEAVETTTTPAASATPARSPNSRETDTANAAALESALASTAPEAAQSEDNYRVRLPCFEGPLDLLLHLIRKEQVNIYDIPIARVCKTYLEHLELMQQLDFNIAGEFMVMASTLMYLKSLTLLPSEEAENAEDDPRRELVAQLVEYEKYKKAADQIDAMKWMGRDIYLRPEGAYKELMPTEALLDAPLEPIDTFQMLLCLKVALDRTTKKPMKIESDPISIKSKVTAVTQYLSDDEILEFVKLAAPKSPVQEIITAFLAILELAKLKFIEIIQSENFGPIQVRAVRPMRELNLALLDSY